MPGFKDIIRADIDNVFMNPDEFATLHTVNGKKKIGRAHV